MKLTIPQPALAAVLAKGGAVAPKNSPAPIVNNVRLTAAVDSLIVASTDLDRFAESSAECSPERGGSTTVNAAALIALVGRYPKDGVVSLELEGATLTVKCGRSRVRFGTLPAEDFTALADMPFAGSFSLSSEEFARLIGRPRVAVQSDNAMTVIQGVYLHVRGDKLRAVGTDKHRLVMTEVDAPEGAAACPGIIIGPEVIDTALRIFKGAGEITIEVSDSRIALSSQGARLVSKVIGGNYINYEAVIPAPGDRAATFTRAAFSESMSRAVLVTEEGAFYGVCAFPAEGGFELTSRNGRGGAAVEGVEAEVTEDFEAFSFNPVYMADFLAMFTSPSLRVEQSAWNQPHRVTAEDDEGLVGVLMPLGLPPSRAA